METSVWEPNLKRKQQKQQLGQSFPNDWVSIKENCQELTIIKRVAHSRNWGCAQFFNQTS